jgi:hypothetical protein
VPSGTTKTVTSNCYENTVAGESGADLVEANFAARELISEGDAFLGDGAFGLLLLTSSFVEQHVVFFRMPLIGPPENEVREALPRRNQRRPRRRKIQALGIGTHAAPLGHFVENQRSAANQPVENAGAPIRIDIDRCQGQREVQPFGTLRGIFEALSLGEIPQHQSQVTAADFFGLERAAERFGLLVHVGESSSH